MLPISDRVIRSNLLLRYLLIFVILLKSTATKLPSNQLLGIKYISYDNFDGTIANGDCCDDPGKKAGSCTPDMCDTVFGPCGTSSTTQMCDVMMEQFTPATYNDNTFVFGPKIGNGVNVTSKLFVLKFPFIKGNINMSIRAVEVPDVGTKAKREDIATFRFVVDWVDPIFLRPPNYRRLVLNDTRAQLVLDIVSQCSKYYFTEDCSIYCKPDKEHYECLDNGTIRCLPGWMGTGCLTLIDYCPGNQCQHGGTCVPVLLGYNCTCTPGFTGERCETLTTTSTPATTATSTGKVTTTTPSKVTTTATSTGKVTTTTPSKVSTTATSTGKVTTTATSTGKVTTTTPSKVTTTATSTGKVTTTTPSKVSTTTATQVTLPTSNTNHGHLITTNAMSSNNSKAVSDDESIVGVAAGSAVGLLLLLIILAIVAYYIKKKKERSQVSPEEKPPLDPEEQVSPTKTVKDAMDFDGIELKEAMKPREEVLKSLDEF